MFTPILWVTAEALAIKVSRRTAGERKASLCLAHKQIPPIANLETPNPNIPFEKLGLRLARTRISIYALLQRGVLKRRVTFSILHLERIVGNPEVAGPPRERGTRRV